MGKKRQKMKELSVAIAEASSIQGAEKGQEHVQSQAPRKRGRPRKIIVIERSQEKKIEAIEEAASTAEKSKESSKKKEEQQQQQQQEESAIAAACISINTKEEEIQLPKGEPSRSRARRKSKPRKST
ncbi:hypothetical protein Lal_00002285 [Lupinus albus]|uniref:Uncharacterized protein n=1 Tax=Lupinus albus TaxID=3870 RepID=A0A6A4PQN1_LUPAL|nr:hypothetical protein Lalb_Chr11g0062341 [Lupinus albus]KAF1893762.1 hypothetical protein Lal_00002285 [Lupinus albus]